MKKLFLILALMIAGITVPVQHSQAQIPILDIIKGAIKKVIKAVDLQIQRQQNKVIWLQNAQKTLENTMSKLKLDEISEWTERQRTLYKDYFEALQKVKSAIAYYKRIRDIADKQIALVGAYKQAWDLFQQDKHFTAEELLYMQRVYAGILDESVKNMDQLYMVANSFQTQMTDAKRLELIDAAADKVETNYNDLQRFNRQNIGLSLQRARDAQELERVKQSYGLQ